MIKMKLVILSGAGLSAESGIQTFRDADGLWNDHSVDEVATLVGFTENPEMVHAFYNQRRREAGKAKPNAAHLALASLDTLSGAEVLHVTQNIDDLCEQAGSCNVLHMHGELMKCRCLSCGEISACNYDLDVDDYCESCGFTSEWGALRPHIVWFNEVPMHLQIIEQALNQCDLFVAIGTSGNVYPAAGFAQRAQAAGAKTVLLNKEAPVNAAMFDEIILGNASEIVPGWVETSL